MPYNGSGVFTVFSPGTPYVTGTTISSSVANNVNGDFATGLSTCLLKDGTQTATAVIPFAAGISSTKITFTTTTGIVGSTTNDSAAAGSVGEIITSTIARVSAVALVNSTAKTVTSIALTAGDWDVFGFLGIDFNSSTNVTRIGGSFSATTNVDGAEAAVIQQYYGAAGLVPTAALQMPIQTIRVSLSGSATYYLVANVTFSVAAAAGYGTISARRRR